MFKVYSIKFVIRVLVFITAVLIYLNDKSSLTISNALMFNGGIRIIHFIWLIFVVEMLQKFFPNKFTSVGCSKQFKTAYRPTERELTKVEISELVRGENIAAKRIFLAWFGTNAVVGLLYYTKVFQESDLVLLSLFYFVCDYICVLFFCPFQYFFMKNRCCITCRIFNWDSIMFLTPLMFIPSFFSVSLIAIALFILIRWEVTYQRYPERFLEQGNANLKCRQCQEKLCKVKKAIYLHVRSMRDASD